MINKGTKELSQAIKWRMLQAMGTNDLKSLATLLGVSTRTVSQTANQRTIPVRWIRTVALETGVRAEWLETGAEPMRTGAAQPEPVAAGRMLDFSPGMFQRLLAAGLPGFEVEVDGYRHEGQEVSFSVLVRKQSEEYSTGLRESGSGEEWSRLQEEGRGYPERKGHGQV